jgi:hypothetical protein
VRPYNEEKIKNSLVLGWGKGAAAEGADGIRAGSTCTGGHSRYVIRRDFVGLDHHGESSNGTLVLRDACLGAWDDF